MVVPPLTPLDKILLSQENLLPGTTYEIPNTRLMCTGKKKNMLEKQTTLSPGSIYDCCSESGILPHMCINIGLRLSCAKEKGSSKWFWASQMVKNLPVNEWKQFHWEAGVERSCIQIARVLLASQEASLGILQPPGMEARTFLLLPERYN